MAFLNSVALASRTQPLAPQPRLSAPVQAHADCSRASTRGVDRIEHSDAKASPNAATHAPGTANNAALLPLLVAGGLLIGAAVLAGPELAGIGLAEGGSMAADGAALAGGAIATGASMTEGAAEVGSVVARSGTFLATAAREAAAEYRAGAAKLANLDYTDPKQLGKLLGAQGWSATEELGRSSVVGAGLAGGAWAFQAAAAAIARLSGSATVDASQR